MLISGSAEVDEFVITGNRFDLTNTKDDRFIFMHLARLTQIRMKLSVT